MAKEIIVLRAEEARNRADESPVFMTELNKAIHDASKHGRVVLWWDVYSVSKNRIETAIADLTARGFTAALSQDQSTLQIKW